MFSIGPYKNLTSAELFDYLATASDSAAIAMEEAVNLKLVRAVNQILKEFNERSTMRARFGRSAPRDQDFYPNVKYDKPFENVELTLVNNELVFEPENLNPFIAYLDPQARPTLPQIFPYFEGRMTKENIVISDIDNPAPDIFTGDTPKFKRWVRLTKRAPRIPNDNNLIPALVKALDSYIGSLEGRKELGKLISELNQNVITETYDDYNDDEIEAIEASFQAYLSRLQQEYSSLRLEVVVTALQLRIKTKINFNKLRNSIQLPSGTGFKGTERAIKRLKRLTDELKKLSDLREAQKKALNKKKSIENEIKKLERLNDIGAKTIDAKNNLKSVKLALHVTESKMNKIIKKLEKAKLLRPGASRTLIK